MQLTEAKLFELLGRLYATKELLVLQSQQQEVELKKAQQDNAFLNRALEEALATPARTEEEGQ